MEQIPRGLWAIQGRGTLLWSGSQARLTLEMQGLKLWGFSGESRELLVPFLRTLRFHFRFLKSV